MFYFRDATPLARFEKIKEKARFAVSVKDISTAEFFEKIAEPSPSSFLYHSYSLENIHSSLLQDIVPLEPLMVRNGGGQFPEKVKIQSWIGSSEK